MVSPETLAAVREAITLMDVRGRHNPGANSYMLWHREWVELRAILFSLFSLFSLLAAEPEPEPGEAQGGAACEQCEGTGEVADDLSSAMGGRPWQPCRSCSGPQDGGGDREGKSVRAGEWIDRGTGFWALRLRCSPPLREQGSVTYEGLADGHRAWCIALGHAGRGMEPEEMGRLAAQADRCSPPLREQGSGELEEMADALQVLAAGSTDVPVGYLLAVVAQLRAHRCSPPPPEREPQRSKGALHRALKRVEAERDAARREAEEARERVAHLQQQMVLVAGMLDQTRTGDDRTDLRRSMYVQADVLRTVAVPRSLDAQGRGEGE